MSETKNPFEKDQITNADESKKLPDDAPEPMEGMKTENPSKEQAEDKKTDNLDSEPEGTIEEGNVAAKEEEDTRELDGSNANNLRTK